MRVVSGTPMVMMTVRLRFQGFDQNKMILRPQSQIMKANASKSILRLSRGLLMITRVVIGLIFFSLTSSANAETPLRSGSTLTECVTIKYRDTPVCLNKFTCIETPQSSFVRKICYDATKSYMLIKLNETWYH